jgi:hypothetical protein
VTWLLVDPAPFACSPTERIQIRQDYFTDEFAKGVAAKAKSDGCETLFICDVRSMDNGHKEDDRETRVSADMTWQQQWVRVLRPAAAMLKFRLPYATESKGDTETSTYLDGDVFLPVWGGRTTTETRLVVTDPVGGWSGREDARESGSGRGKVLLPFF